MILKTISRGTGFVNVEIGCSYRVKFSVAFSNGFGIKSIVGCRQNLKFLKLRQETTTTLPFMTKGKRLPAHLFYYLDGTSSNTIVPEYSAIGSSELEHSIPLIWERFPLFWSLVPQTLISLTTCVRILKLIQLLETELLL